MKHERSYSPLCPLLLLGVAALPACGSSTASEEDVSAGAKEGALQAECVEADTPVASEDWTCGEELTVACTSGTGKQDVEALVVPMDDDHSCEDTALSVSDEGPFAVGDHVISVTNDGGATVCEATLHVTDDEAPTATAKPVIALWPPNHKLHPISVADCATATDTCNGELAGEFIWASSDEPIDDLGDGHHAPDIVIDSCGQVSVRAERQGPKDGRVYKLGVRFVDGAGNAVESECTIIVDHDKRGVEGADSGEAYRIALDGTDETPVCDGVVEQPEDDGDDDGSTGGDSTGSTGGDSTGSTGGDSTGSTGGDSTGSTGGSTGGDSTGSTGGSDPTPEITVD